MWATQALVRGMCDCYADFHVNGLRAQRIHLPFGDVVRGDVENEALLRSNDFSTSTDAHEFLVAHGARFRWADTGNCKDMR